MEFHSGALRAPLCVSWQLTHACDLACVHCCTDSGPDRAAAEELDREGSLRLAGDIVACEVPYVMLCGGEPLLAPQAFAVAEVLGRGGVQLKIETNGQSFGPAEARRLAALPIRSVQVSLDGDTQEVYARQRPGASLEKAHAACRAVREAGLPLEVTFAPTRRNIGEIAATVRRARDLGAFRFNTGALMRVGRAARRWEELEPTPEEYAKMISVLSRMTDVLGSAMELCYHPFTIAEGMSEALREPPATLLILPDGTVKVSAFLEEGCAFVPRQGISEAWDAYRRAWKDPEVRRRLAEAP
ncbi:MAG: hypothetical protein A2X36_10140 [Elusimicrobia bacterium GWA2_69_24]|nr:MAG: hypothetical protein A2X36_10140 [Elusimicrobia bacterium GWA2_69_24]HBL19197.1 hypothetical protein [Elusimicrobiota bacterium]